MRCLSCNAPLSEDEATLKDHIGKYMDTCFVCLEVIDRKVGSKSDESDIRELDFERDHISYDEEDEDEGNAYVRYDE